MISDMVETFRFLYPQVARNGVYMVEDLHAAYWEEYEGGYRKPGTFIELCKQLIDELNADHARGAISRTSSLPDASMHLYDSVAVFERGAHTKKWAPKIGKADFVSDTAQPGAVNYGPNLQRNQPNSDRVEAMQRQLTEAVSARDEAQAVLQKTRDSVAVAEGTLARMQSSLSWKITEPVRRLMTALRSGPRKTE